MLCSTCHTLLLLATAFGQFLTTQFPSALAHPRRDGNFCAPPYYSFRSFDEKKRECIEKYISWARRAAIFFESHLDCGFCCCSINTHAEPACSVYRAPPKSWPREESENPPGGSKRQCNSLACSTELFMTSRLRPGLCQHTRFCVDFIICGIQEIHAASQHKQGISHPRAAGKEAAMFLHGLIFKLMNPAWQNNHPNNIFPELWEQSHSLISPRRAVEGENATKCHPSATLDT